MEDKNFDWSKIFGDLIKPDEKTEEEKKKEYLKKKYPGLFPKDKV